MATAPATEEKSPCLKGVHCQNEDKGMDVKQHQADIGEAIAKSLFA